MLACVQGYLSSLSMKAFSYINLDGVIAGISLRALAQNRSLFLLF